MFSVMIIYPFERDLSYFLSSRGDVDRFTHWARFEGAIVEAVYSLLTDGNVGSLTFDAERAPVMHQGGDEARTDATIGVKHQIMLFSKCEDTTFNQLNGELTGVDGLLNVVSLHIGNLPKSRVPLLLQKFPYVRGILAEWIT